MIKHEMVKVDAELARIWLEQNDNNRSKRPALIKKFATDMAAGRWLENGSSVVIADTGRLLDGQHRLEAVIESGAVVRMMVVTGVKEAAMITIDTGATRSMGDLLKFEGKTYYNQLAASIRWALTIKAGTVSIFNRMSRQEALDWLHKNSGLETSMRQLLELSSTLNKHLHVPAGILIGLHFWFAKKDRVLADQFLNSLISGDSSEKNFHSLREQVIEAKNKRRQLFTIEMAARAIKAWNASREGEIIKTHRWSITDNEPFPVIQ